jgi:hypothetical protein
MQTTVLIESVVQDQGNHKESERGMQEMHTSSEKRQGFARAQLHTHGNAIARAAACDRNHE